ncbi:anti-sigma factor family protein [Rhizohabitans arisaemae]|uniref:anti-sigma factor family protein n=1 Tax=Rhizohabitans arisaemae TaxID=2720610 RepID=UPI0024B220D7|nr:zf-HC2 domain-containing protein [Rhizohabitans arisaemae]
MRKACDDVRLLLGGYVLDAVGAGDRAIVEAHTRICESCRAELAELAALPAFLGMVTERELEQAVSPPPELLERVVGLASRERGRRRFRSLVAVAAATVVAASLGAVWAISGEHRETIRAVPAVSPSVRTPVPTRTPEPSVTIDARDQATNVSARLRISPTPGGTAVEIRLTGVPVGTRCSLIAISKDGGRERAASWRFGKGDYRENGTFVGRTGFAGDQLAAFEVLSTKGTRILWIPVGSRWNGGGGSGG